MERPNDSRHRILMIVTIAALSSACSKESPPASTAPLNEKQTVQQAAPNSAAALSLLDFEIAKNSAGKPVLKGNIGNASTRKINYAAAEFKLLDKSGGEIGTVTASTNNLEAKFSWGFEVEIPQEGAASAKLVAITTK